jgi:hypothetical protein
MLRFLDASVGGPFSNLPGNSSLSSESPYICIVPVRMIYLLSRQRAETIGQPWVLGGISESTIDDLRSRRCILLLDLSNEGAPDVPDVFEEIYRWASEKAIATSSIALITQNRALASAHSTRHGQGSIGFLCYDYFVMAMAQLFGLDDESFHDKVGFARHEIHAAIDNPKRYSFLCLNATPRPHRIALVSLLRRTGLLADVRLSFHGNKAGSEKEGAENVQQVQRELERLGALDLLDVAQSYLHSDPIYVDRIDRRGNELHDAIDLQPYADTAISLVTETEFTDGQMTRITEKTVKALALGHPTIVFGNPFSLTLSQQLGFQTFAPFIDERYDEALDGKDRFWRVAAELERISRLRRMGDPDGSCLDADLRQICRYNANHAATALTGRYRAAVEQPFIAEVSRRFAELRP